MFSVRAVSNECGFVLMVGMAITSRAHERS